MKRNWLALLFIVVFAIVAAVGSLSLTVSAQDELSGSDLEKVRSVLKKRESELLRKQAEIERRERSVTEREKLLGEQVSRYEKIIRELNEKVRAARKYEEERVAGLRKIYEKMEPKKAAGILNRLPVSVAAEILASIRNTQAAEIMGKMSSGRAKEVTEAILDRRISSVSPGFTEPNQPARGGD